jgi:hypothetical protein
MDANKLTNLVHILVNARSDRFDKQELKNQQGRTIKKINSKKKKVRVEMAPVNHTLTQQQQQQQQQQHLTLPRSQL